MKIMVALALLFASATAVAAAPAAPPRSTDALAANGWIPVLIVSGSDAFHDWRRTTPQLRAQLKDSGRFDVRVVEDAEALAAPGMLANYRAVLLNGQAPRSSAALRRSLQRYVEGGGGLVALHWAVDNFSDWPGFADLLGRVWREGTSVEEHGRFDVTVAQPHPITAGMPNFSTADREAVHYRLRGTAKVDVLATARSNKTGEAVPVMITHRVGRGRVFFSPFGHSVASREDPDVATMIVRAAEWAAKGQVSEDVTGAAAR